MSRNMAQASNLRPHEVEVRLVASGAQLSPVRALALDIALREDFDLDAMSDLRLAVAEACATVVRLADPEGVLTCRFRAITDGVEMTATAPTANQPPPVDDSPTWWMLDMLIDSAECWTTHADGEQLFHLRITKQASRERNAP